MSTHELKARLREQARRYGAELRAGRVEGLERTEDGFALSLEGGERLGVRKASPSAATQPAAVVAADGDALLVGTGDGTLRLETVQPAGGKPMSAADYLRGHKLPKLA